MKKNLYSLIVLIFLSALGVSMFGQEKTAKPLMKITVKDGKVVSAVPLDGSANPDLASDASPAEDNLTIISNGVEQNSQVSAAVREDTLKSPDRASMRPNPQDSEMDWSTLEVSPGDPGEPGADPDELIITNDMISDETEVKPEKGQHLPVVTKPCSAVFDPETANVLYLQNDSRDVKENYVTQEADIRPEAAWEIIMSNDFEGVFPAPDWNCFAASGAADAYWDDNPYRAVSGSWSLFCADYGTASVSPPADYPDNMDSWAIYGPFDLSDATDADLNFDLWLDAESGWDYFSYMVSIDGTNYYGHSQTGITGGPWDWIFWDLESVPTLGNITGNSEVYFALRFESDGINIGGPYEGAFVDDLTIWKYAQDVDLYPSALTLSTFSWYPGLSVSADLTEVNSGTDPAQAHYSRLYLSPNTTITTGDIQLGGDLYFSSIAAGGSQTHYNHTFTAPTVADGSYYVGIIVDIYNDCHETNESNSFYLPTPVEYIPNDIDLYWTSLAVTTDLWSGGLSVTATLTEANGGTGSAGGHYSRLYLSDNATISSSDTQLGGDLYFSSIAAGGSQAVAESFTAPAMPSGSYYMGAIVDYYDDVVESDESNNINYRMGMIGYDPDIDLMSTSIGLSTSTWVVGSPVIADLTEVNTGLDASGAHYSRLYLSADNTITPGVDVQLGGDLYFSSIAAGGSQTVGGHTFNAPDVTDGTYYVGNFVDVYNDVVETNEANNFAVRAGMVDIILPTFTINATVQPAGSGTVSGTGIYDLNQSATLEATPATGYEFVNWTESGSVVSTQESYVFTVTSDRNLVANFQLITLQVTTGTNPVEGGTASGGGSYPYGSSVTLLAVP
ncbi:MAG: CARDB domain-containing protein, partial [Bacteroidota bacterium]|nr:CARDB domain-containing protein [Bacteroidota bacterium]